MDVEEIKRYVEANIADIREVRDIAVRFKVRADTLRKTFSRAEQIPLSEFINLVRVSRAKELLEETEEPCFQVCYDVGFAREDSGLRTFKRVVGMTMNQYRIHARRKHASVRQIRSVTPVASFNCP